MNQRTSLLVAAGIDPRQGSVEAAAMLVRSVPLRIGLSGPETPEEAVDCRWCSGIKNYSEILNRIVGSPCRWGQAFGVRWPWFGIDDHVVSPGLPVRSIRGAEEIGPDGAYTNDGESIFREAAGRRNTFLEMRTLSNEDRPAFSLLWFSDTARFLVKGTTLEVDDLFSRTRCGLTRPTIERLLVRTHRVDAGVLEGLFIGNNPEPTTVEVARPVQQTDGPLPDPEAYFWSRVDVKGVSVERDQLIIKDHRDEEIVFRMTCGEEHWHVDLVEGLFPYRAVDFVQEGEQLILRAVLGNEADIFSPGLRGRVVFDLNADLGELVERHSKR